MIYYCSKKTQQDWLTFRLRHPILVGFVFCLLTFFPTIVAIVLNVSIFCSDPSSLDNYPYWITHRLHDIRPIKENDDVSYNEVNDALIFVSIATYRDPECRNTILQVFEKAKYPDRLRVGIFQQNNITDLECNDFRDVLNCDNEHYDYSNLFTNDTTKFITRKPHVLCGRQWQIKMSRIHWEHGLGPTYGRYRAELFYDDEEYVLQMDSHTALAPNWDVLLIDMFLSLKNDYAVLTTYPHPLRNPTLWNYNAPAASNNKFMYVICGTDILKDKATKSFKLTPGRNIINLRHPIMTAFFAAGFSFQKGHRLLNVPYDPYSPFLFDGEEMSMAIRMWTHGYDFYAPDKDISYHLYSPNDAKIRPVFWEHKWNVKWKIARDSEYRINYIMGLHEKFHPTMPLSKIDVRQVDKYGLGTHRKSQDFWNFTKIDLVKLTSENLCDEYSKGGLEKYRVPWTDIENDPYLKTHPK